MTFSRTLSLGLVSAGLAASLGGGTYARAAEPELVLSERVQAEQRGEARPARVNNTTALPNPVGVQNGTNCNELVLAAVRAMPQGGSYSTSPKANAALGEAIQLDAAGKLKLKPSAATPCYCSGATYLVFLSVLDRLEREGRFHQSPEVWKSLLMQRQTDGVGVWGRWNANGPGTAALFHELRIGQNFTSVEDAQPGDFAKLWWSDEIGARERGHSVIFIRAGKEPKTGEPTVTFWSANLPEGFSEKTVPRAKIKRALISRLTNADAIRNAPELPARDAYLAEMLKRGSTEQEMFAKVGVSGKAK